MWYLIVSIPDLCTLTYFESPLTKLSGSAHDRSIKYVDATIAGNLQKLNLGKFSMISYFVHVTYDDETYWNYIQVLALCGEDDV